ncbi:MAG TPA: ribonuclease P [Methanoculleus sp.]|nr:ribonuclease P [Methanoculleus sp.]
MAAKSKHPNRRKIAMERIETLFAEAERVHAEHPAWSDRYVERALAIAIRTRVRIPRALRRRYCRRCHAYLVFGKNARVRIHGGKVVVTCRACGYQRRYRVVKPDNGE